MNPSSSLPDPAAVARDDLVALGRACAAALMFGAVVTVAFLLVAPGRVVSMPVALAALGACFALAVVCGAAPWWRLGSAWAVVPILCAEVLVAIAIADTGGTGSPYVLFYLVAISLAAYHCPRRKVVLIAGVTTVLAFLPVLYDHSGSLEFQVVVSLLFVALCWILAVVLGGQRTRLRALVVQAEALSLVDPLTGIANQRGLDHRMAVELERARHHGRGLTLLYIDLDGLGHVHDTLGHAAADEILRRAANAMAATLRGDDFVARHGGDEFAALLPASTPDDAARAEARLRAALERIQLHPSAEPGGLTATIGLATYPDDGGSLDELLAVADGALMRAKDARGAERAALPAPTPQAAPGIDPLDPAVEAVAGPVWSYDGIVSRLLAATAVVLGAWFVLPLLVAPGIARGAASVAVFAVTAAACVRVSRRVEGIEVIGWRLIAAGVMAGALPYVNLGGTLVIGAGVLLLGGRRWLTDRYAVLDGVNILGLCAAMAAAFLVPEVVEDVRGSMAGQGAALTGVVAAVLIVSVGLLVAYRSRPSERPHVWIVAVAYVIAGLAGVPYIVGEWTPWLPSRGWEVIFPLCALMAATAARIRSRAPGPIPSSLRTDAAEARHGMLTVRILLQTLLVASLVVFGDLPTVPLVLLIVVMVPLNHLRFVMESRDHEALLAASREGEARQRSQYRASLVALTAAIEARDGYTGRHGHETVALAGGVARRLGLNAREVGEIETVALLHDLGKLGIPDVVLRKPGPLTPDEWEVMRQHPAIGERIVRAVPGLEVFADAVRHEHERWDGTGYPDGLAGEEIPLPSRIVLVCDAFHAMTSDRPYRGGVGVAAALAELRECSGSQFDPAVVTALTALVTGPDGAVAWPDRARDGAPAANGAPIAEVVEAGLRQPATGLRPI